MINESSSTDELLRCLQVDSDEEAWKYLNARYMARFVSYARGKSLSYNDAEDVANETLEQVVLSIDLYNGARGDQWIWAIHKNKVIDRLRQRKFVACEEIQEAYVCPVKDSPETCLEQKEQWQAFLRAWDRLPLWAREKLRLGQPGRKGKQWEQAKELLKSLMLEEEEKNGAA